MRERRVETALTSAVKARGGWAVKLLPSVSGLPDRLVLLPGGRIFFVELKAPNKRPTVHQTVVHRRLKELGFEVAVLSSPEMVKDWVTNIG